LAYRHIPISETNQIGISPYTDIQKQTKPAYRHIPISETNQIGISPYTDIRKQTKSAYRHIPISENKPDQHIAIYRYLKTNQISISPYTDITNKKYVNNLNLSLK
jgi:hypothetical protein